MRRWILILGVAFSLVLAGCSDDKKTNDASKDKDKKEKPAAATPAGKGGEFCGAVTENAANLNSANTAVPTDPAEVKKLIEATAAAYEAIDEFAPEEIAEDLKTAVGASRAFAEALATVNFDFSKLPPETLALMGDPTVTAASTRIAEYMARECGISAPSGATQ